MKTNEESKILSCQWTMPSYRYSFNEVFAYAEKNWFSTMPKEKQNLARRVFRGAEIDTRYSAFPLEEIFQPLSFKEKNDRYISAAIALGAKALLKTLESAGLAPTDLDVLITTSCTGFMIPSMDSYLVNQLKLRKDILRLPITEMGCAGGTSGLIYASQFAKANPQYRIAVLAVELPSITLQWSDYSPENLVSSAIFGDGAACVILGPTSELAPKIIAHEMFHFENATHLMGYELQNTGLKIILDREIPSAIENELKNIIIPFLSKHEISLEAVHYYLFHPGGKKIINLVEKFIQPFNKDISLSKSVLKNFGNLSSATILVILAELIKTKKMSFKMGESGYMLAFGPGFTAQSLLLKWT